MSTDYKFNTTDPPDAKLIIDFTDEMPFDTHARGKSLGDRNLMKNYNIKRALLASGLKGDIPHEASDSKCHFPFRKTRRIM